MKIFAARKVMQFASGYIEQWMDSMVDLAAAMDRLKQPVMMPIDNISSDIVMVVVEYCKFMFAHAHPKGEYYAKGENHDIPEFKIEPEVALEVYIASKALLICHETKRN